MAQKILVMEAAFKELRSKIVEYAAENNFEVVFCAPETKEEFLEYFSNKDVFVILNTWPNARTFGGYDNDMIRKIAASGVKAVCHQGAGYDVVGDTELWKEYGVVVSNCPNSPAPDTADTAVFLLLGALRQFYRFSKSLRDGNWRGPSQPGVSTVGITLGILGIGNIGRMIRDRTHPFGFSRILYHQRRRLSPDLEKGSEFVPDVDEFLRQCDAVVIVVPHNKATHHLISRDRLFNTIKHGATIVNVARGPVIDEAALVDALNADKISSVGLDVFENEPEIHPGLIGHERAFLLPHVGTHTYYAWRAFEEELFSCMRSFIETGHLRNQVN